MAGTRPPRPSEASLYPEGWLFSAHPERATAETRVRMNLLDLLGRQTQSLMENMKAFISLTKNSENRDTSVASNTGTSEDRSAESDEEVDDAFSALVGEFNDAILDRYKIFLSRKAQSLADAKEFCDYLVRRFKALDDKHPVIGHLSKLKDENKLDLYLFLGRTMQDEETAVQG